MESPEPHTLSELTVSLDRLIDEADSLARDVAAAADADGSTAIRLELAERVLPVSAKDPPSGVGPARARYLISLERRRIRLQREGAALAERLAALRARADSLRQSREDLALAQDGMRAHGARAIDNLRACRDRREAVLQWAAESALRRREVVDWAQRVARHRRRADDAFAEPAPPPPGALSFGAWLDARRLHRRRP